MKLVNWHFWISTLGIVLYISAMWVAGIMQGLMWRAYTSLGFLEYSFIETVAAMHPYYVIRALGGALFLIGALIMAFNLWMTVRKGPSPPPSRIPPSSPSLRLRKDPDPCPPLLLPPAAGVRSGPSTRSSRPTRSS